MKITLAASIYPPEIGGPAQYAKNLKEALERAGHSVVLVRYGGLKRFPSGIRHALYAIKLLVQSRGTDAMIAFDTYSGGLPAAISSGNSTLNARKTSFLSPRCIGTRRNGIGKRELYSV